MRSSDGNLTIEYVKNKHEIVIPASDVLVVNAPTKLEEMEQLNKSIRSLPSTEKYLVLLLFRHNKSDLIESFSNLKNITELEFLDYIDITYQKSSRRTGTFVHLGEIGFLFYKGTQPNVSNTAWFRQGQLNASNHWDLSPYSIDEDKEDVEQSVYPKFSWDLGLLLFTLGMPQQHKKIVWTLPYDDNLLKFVINFNIKLHLITSSDEESIEAATIYEALLKEKTEANS